MSYIGQFTTPRASKEFDDTMREAEVWQLEGLSWELWQSIEVLESDEADGFQQQGMREELTKLSLPERNALICRLEYQLEQVHQRLYQLFLEGQPSFSPAPRRRK